MLLWGMPRAAEQRQLLVQRYCSACRPGHRRPGSSQGAEGDPQQFPTFMSLSDWVPESGTPATRAAIAHHEVSPGHDRKLLAHL